MAKYQVLEKTWVSNENRWANPGEVIEFDGEPGSNLGPVPKKGKGADASAPEETGDGFPGSEPAAQ